MNWLTDERSSDDVEWFYEQVQMCDDHDHC